MKALLIWLVLSWIAAGAGRTLLLRWRALAEIVPLTGLEAFVYASALGLGVAAYGVFALGLVGLLSYWPVTLWWLVLAGIGLPGMRAHGRELAAWPSRWRSSETASPDSGRAPGRILMGAALLTLLLLGLIALLACFRAPGAIEWDVISYHLADPKVFLQQHRITGLPTEHHSNFPFTIEMLFSVGLLYEGYALANLFHFLTAALTALALIAWCRRFFAPPVGVLAALLFVSTPIVFWEASVAYLDLGLALYVTLALFAALTAAAAGRPDGARKHAGAWMALAGVLTGFALGVKYLALVPFALLGLWLLLRRLPLRGVLAYFALAIAIGSPWYLKNIVLTHNPVYPYFYKLFPQSRYWSADREAAYKSEQNSFGAPHALGQPREAVLNLLQAPWQLLTHSQRYYNGGEYTFLALVGGLYFAYLFGLAFLKPLPRALSVILWLAFWQFAAWFFVSQVARYLIPTLPLLAVGGGYFLWRAGNLFPLSASPLSTPPFAKALSSTGQERAVQDSEISGRPATEAPMQPAALWTGIGALALLAAFVQAGLLLWTLAAWPTGGAEARAMRQRGVPTNAFGLTDIASAVADPASQQTRLRRELDNYEAMEWINQNTPAGAGVVLYDDVRGFYLDRPYLWGNSLHSSYIPYETLSDGAALTAWLRQHNIRYALINMNYSPANTERNAIPSDPAIADQVLQSWYVQINPQTASRWQQLVADALRRHLWTMVETAHGNVVLQLADANSAEKVGRKEGNVKSERRAKRNRTGTAGERRAVSRPPRRKAPLSDPGPALSPLPPQGAELIGPWKAAIPLLLFLYLVSACLHAFLVPTGQTGYQNAPDEAAHVQFARAVAHGHLPTHADDRGSPPAYEWHQPPLYYVLAAPFSFLGDRAIRGVSIICGLLSLLLIFRGVRLLFPNDPQLAVLALGIAALTPTHIAITSTVNNDALLELCFSWTLLLLIASLLGGFTRWRACWLGVALAAALLTKATALLLIPVVLLALILVTRTGEAWREVVGNALYSAGFALVLTGWWFVRNMRLYGELVPIKTFNQAFGGTATAAKMQAAWGGMGPYLLRTGQWSFQSFWAVFGTPESAKLGIPIFLPGALLGPQLYGIISLVVVASLVGMGLLHLRCKTEFTQVQIFAIWLLAATLLLVGLAFVGFLLKYFQAQGRYLYPAMLPISLFLALGWRALFPVRWKGVASGLLLAILGLMVLVFLLLI